jgi:hypothetical protein
LFTALLHRVEDRTRVLDTYLRLCNSCDDAIANHESALFQELSSRNALPTNLAEERIFRHCAIMTQLYGIYELFAESTLSFWLSRLPRYQAFPDLPEAFKNAYREGIAHVIRNIERRRYRHLTLPSVLGKYLASVQGDSSWEFVDDALTSHESNLRHSQFVRMFNSVGLEGVWQSLEENTHIIEHKAESDSNKSLEQLVLDLVTFRNEASHGAPDEILGSDVLNEWIGFVRAFCSALADVITHRVVSAEATYKPNSVIGTVTETLRDNIVIVTCELGMLRVGESIYFLREKDCTNAKIESLHLNDVNHEEIHIDQIGIEVGVKTSIKVRGNTRLVRLEDRHDASGQLISGDVRVLPDSSIGND